MIFNWLTRQDKANKVIVFFNGWGLGQTVVEHLAPIADTDVLLISDYTNLDSELPDLGAYQHRCLIAWSFGVANYTAWQLSHSDTFDTKIAINGTMRGIDRKFGIARKVVQHTIDTLSLNSYKEFIHRCYNNQLPEEAKQIVENITEAEINSKRIELQNIIDRDYSNNTNLLWDTVWIGQKDGIFPTKNQQLAWQGSQTRLIDSAHAPFAYWLNWRDIFSKQ